MVRVVPPLATRMALHVLLPKATVPLPLKVCVPLKLRLPKEPFAGCPICAVPFKTSPFVTATVTPLVVLPTSSSPVTVTPSRVLPLKRPAINRAPPVVATVPRWIVPPLRTQEPLVASSVNVLFVFSNVPVRYIDPPTRLKVPNPALAKWPPRFSRLLLTAKTPLFVQLPLRKRVAPLVH